MARQTQSFVCQNCGAAYGRWQGKCDACGEWNTIAEENAAVRPSRRELFERAGRRGHPRLSEPLADTVRRMRDRAS